MTQPTLETRAAPSFEDMPAGAEGWPVEPPPLHVLLVEDNPFDTELIRQEIAHAGIRAKVTSAVDEDSLRRALSDHPDVVLTDYNVPGLEIFTTLEIARDTVPLTPIIVVTGYVGDQAAAECIKRGAEDYVLKDNLARLPQAITTALEQRRLREAAHSARRETQASESLKAAILESTLDCVVATDAHGLIIEFNPSAEKTFGYARDEVVGKPATDLLVPPRYRDVHEKGLRNYRTEDQHRLVGQRIETEAMRADGSEFPVEISVTEVQLDSGPVFTAVIRDISERRAMETSLRASEERFRSLVQNSRDVIAVIDESAICSYISPGVESLSGYTPDELVGTSGFDFIHPEDLGIVGESLTSILASPDLTHTVEARLKTKDGWIWVEIRAANKLNDPVIRGIVLNYHDTTERRLGEEKLRASERSLAELLRRQEELSAQLRLLLDSTAEGIYGVDDGGLCIFINKAAAERFGGPAEAFIGKHMHSLTHHTRVDGSPYPPEECAIYDAFRKGVGRSIEDEVFWRLDGSSFFVEYSSHPIMGPAGPAGAVLNFRDVTQRKEMEKELRARETLFQGAFSAARTGISIIHSDAKTYMDVNEALCEMVGYTRAELMAMSWTDITHPDDLEVNVAKVTEMIDGGPSVAGLTKRYLRKDGEVITVDITDSLVRDENGDPLYFVTHIVDVTEKEAAAQELKESRELLQAVVNNSPALIYIKDRSGAYLLANDRVLEARSLQADQMLGHTVFDVFPPEVATELARQDERVFTEMRPIEIEEGVPNSDGETRNYLSVKFPLFNGNGDCHAMCGISTDVTDRVRSIEEKEKLEARLQQSQKMEAIGQLAGGVAHDFNNILAVIMNFAEFLFEDLDGDDPRRADVNEIAKAGAKAARLVQQLLAFSRKEVVEPKVIDLNEVISDLKGLLRRAVGEDIALHLEPGCCLPQILADPGQIEQVLLNLSVNARDAMPRGGSLSISTDVVFLEDEQCPGLDAGSYVCLSVQDTGEGMDVETTERIFEPFFTTKERGAGTGLGLSTVYGIVQQAGGGVVVRSSPGEGARFDIYLPIVHDDVAGTEDSAGAHQLVLSSSTGVVVVVEDEEAVRNLVTRILTKNGFEVVSFAGGAEALEHCRSEANPIDLLLTDVVMPGMSGKELSDALATIRPGVRTLYMSGYTDEIIAQRGVLAGGEHLIQKPFQAAEIVARVRSLLDEETK
jgi:two-component system cell cycle sensor histidine kinase/response regulator CckA